MEAFGRPYAGSWLVLDEVDEIFSDVETRDSPARRVLEPPALLSLTHSPSASLARPLGDMSMVEFVGDVARSCSSRSEYKLGAVIETLCGT